MTQKVRKAVIPAAGFGTRLLPFTKCVPKEMLPVAGKPLVQWAVEEAAASGVETVVLVINRNKDLISKHFEPNVKIEKTLERQSRIDETQKLRQVANLCEIRTVFQKSPCGLADAIATAQTEIGDETFAVILPDVLFDSKIPVTRQLFDRYAKHGGCVIAARIVEEDEVDQCGILTPASWQGVNGPDRTILVDSVRERPRPGEVTSRYGIAGRYVLPPEIFHYLKKIKPGFGGELQLSDALSAMLRKTPLHACLVNGLHFDCGSFQGHLRAELAFARKRPDFRVTENSAVATLPFPVNGGIAPRDGVRATSYASRYFQEAIQILDRIEETKIDRVVELLLQLRQRGGRLFFLGVGGSAANASHAVNDFRKLAGIECYAPTDNVAELTARINDDGWETAYRNWLQGSRLNENDAIFILSVGGGDQERNISANLVSALRHAKEVSATILGIVGRDGGFTARTADACIIVPVVNQHTITPHTESFQSLLLHLIVSHPKLKAAEMKWESSVAHEPAA